MTILEASLRNLVREEATNAALKAIEAMPKDPASLAGNCDAVLAVIGVAAEKQFSQLRIAARHVATEQMLSENRAENPASLNHDQLAHYRKLALELAVAKSVNGDQAIPLAAKFARFMIDGALDGKAREPSA